MTDARKVLQTALGLYPEPSEEDMEILWYLYAHRCISTLRLSESFGVRHPEIRAKLEELRKQNLVTYGLSRREYMLTSYVSKLLSTLRGVGIHGRIYMSVPVGVMKAAMLSQILSKHPDLEPAQVQRILRRLYQDGLVRYSRRPGYGMKLFYWRDPA